MSAEAKAIPQATNAEEWIESARQLVRQTLASGSTSQTALARQFGIAAATLSQFVSGKYAGDNKSVADKIHYGFEKMGRQLAAPQDPEFVPTAITQEVTTVLSFTHTHKTMGLVHGDAGIGKTMAIGRYAAEHPDTIVLTADPSLRMPKAIVDELMDALNRKETGTLRRQMKVLISTLSGTGRLIIIDDAQHLALVTLETLRALHDKAGVGIVLVGNHELYDQLRGRSEASYAQFFSRLGIRRCLRAPIADDDVRNIFEPLALDRTCSDVLAVAANAGKGIRGAVKLYRLAATIAQQQAMPLSPSLIQHAARFLMMEA